MHVDSGNPTIHLVVIKPRCLSQVGCLKRMRQSSKKQNLRADVSALLCTNQNWFAPTNFVFYEILFELDLHEGTVKNAPLKDAEKQIKKK